MSGKWADFDPLSRARAKPAAPITSLEQAEVTAVISKPLSRRSEPGSPNVNASSVGGAGHKESANLSESRPSNEAKNPPGNSQPVNTATEPAESTHTESLDPEGAPTPQEHDSNRDAPETSEETDKEARESIKLEQGSKADANSEPGAPDPSTAHKPIAKTPDASQNAASDSTAEAEAAIPSEKNMGVATQTAAKATTQADSLSARKGTTHAEKSSEAPEPVAKEEAEGDDAAVSDDTESNWPTKLHLNETDTEPQHGDLRKNSIAAMKELGSPDARGPEAGTPDEESPFDFQRFMSLLRSRNADPIARYVKSFLQEFSRGVWSPAQQEKIVADFQKFIGVKMREFEPFASLSKTDRRNAAEGMEKLIMNRLYTRTFPPKMPPILRSDGHNEDLLRDQVFEEKLRLWGWVEGRHLDINEGYLQSGFIQLAANELTRLHQFKSPRDKTICVLNCSKVVWALIRQAKLEQNADSFLPLLIYVVLKAQPAYLVSNLNYIQRFRSKDFLRGETAYYLSTLASAVTFIETLDKSSLTINDEEFDHKMEYAIRAENQRQRAQQEQHREHLQRHNTADLEQDDIEAHEGESSAAVLAASAGMLVERMRNFTSKFLDDLSAPEEADSQDRDADSREQQRRAREARRQYRDEEQAAREASREEFRTEQLQRQQFDETSETLQQMFPGLDKDVVEDVLRQSGTNIGSAVDLCLALVETT